LFNQYRVQKPFDNPLPERVHRLFFVSLCGGAHVNPKLVANFSAYASLICVFLFWLGFGLSHLPSFPQLNLSPLHWLGVEAL
jgi:hypothetical protein